MTRPRILFIGAYHPLSSSLYQRPGLRATGKSEKRRIRELESMAPEFVFYPAAATGCRPCRPALPARRKSAAPTGVFRGIPENRRIRELKFMVPGFVERTGGSNRLSALPTGHCLSLLLFSYHPCGRTVRARRPRRRVRGGR